VSLHLSIFANTSQRRTKVRFESIFIDLFNSSDPLGREDDWRRRINAHVDDMPDDYLKYPGNTSISVSAAARNSTFLDFAPDWLIDYVGDGLTVTVMAQVHFKVGIVRTRLYGITVSCDGVVFPNQNDNTSSLRQEGKKVPSHLPQLIYVHLSAHALFLYVCVLYMFIAIHFVCFNKKSFIS